MIPNHAPAQMDRRADEDPQMLFSRLGRRVRVIVEDDIYAPGYVTGATASPHESWQFSGGSVPYDRSQVDRFLGLISFLRTEPSFYGGMWATEGDQSTLAPPELGLNSTAPVGALGRPMTLGEVRMLHMQYDVRDSDRVMDFISRHAPLVSFLFEARERVREYFPGAVVVLELVRHREVDGWAQLFANIVTSLAVDEGLRRLRQLDDEWFLHQLDRVGDLFNFDLEFA
jgi:hypothetical protein